MLGRLTGYRVEDIGKVFSYEPPRSQGFLQSAPASRRPRVSSQ